MKITDMNCEVCGRSNTPLWFCEVCGLEVCPSCWEDGEELFGFGRDYEVCPECKREIIQEDSRNMAALVAVGILP